MPVVTSSSPRSPSIGKHPRSPPHPRSPSSSRFSSRSSSSNISRHFHQVLQQLDQGERRRRITSRIVSLFRRRRHNLFFLALSVFRLYCTSEDRIPSSDHSSIPTLNVVATAHPPSYRSYRSSVAMPNIQVARHNPSTSLVIVLSHISFSDDSMASPLVTIVNGRALIIRLSNGFGESWLDTQAKHAFSTNYSKRPVSSNTLPRA